MTDWDDLKLKPSNLKDVPSGLEWCVYLEERERGEVLLPATIYTIVLALRWILAYTDLGIEEEFETWKVYWKNEDEYGFRTRIFLFRERVEQYDGIDDDDVVLQEQTWVELAALHCGEGKGVINRVYMPGRQPYGGHWELNGTDGVRQLLEDAIRASRATNHHLERFGNGITRAYRVSSLQEASATYLSLRLECDHSQVQGIDLTVTPDAYYHG